MAISYGNYFNLHRRQPYRKGAAIVFYEDAKESLHAAQQRPVNHVRPMPFAVLTYIGHVKPFRQIEVELDRGALPHSFQRVFNLDINLGPIENRLAFYPLVGQVSCFQCRNQRCLGLFPHHIIAGVFFRRSGVAHT